MNSGDLYATRSFGLAWAAFVGSMATKTRHEVDRPVEPARFVHQLVQSPATVIGTKTPYQHCGGIAGVVLDASAIEECITRVTITTRMGRPRAVAGGIVGETKGAVSGLHEPRRHHRDPATTNNYCNLAGIAAA